MYFISTHCKNVFSSLFYLSFMMESNIVPASNYDCNQKSYFQLTLLLTNFQNIHCNLNFCFKTNVLHACKTAEYKTLSSLDQHPIHRYHIQPHLYQYVLKKRKHNMVIMESVGTYIYRCKDMQMKPKTQVI